jgi:hypothetical protein
MERLLALVSFEWVSLAHMASQGIDKACSLSVASGYVAVMAFTRESFAAPRFSAGKSSGRLLASNSFIAVVKPSFYSEVRASAAIDSHNLPTRNSKERKM